MANYVSNEDRKVGLARQIISKVDNMVEENGGWFVIKNQIFPSQDSRYDSWQSRFEVIRSRGYDEDYGVPLAVEMIADCEKNSGVLTADLLAQKYNEARVENIVGAIEVGRFDPEEVLAMSDAELISAWSSSNGSLEKSIFNDFVFEHNCLMNVKTDAQINPIPAEQ